jgi:ADP-heptose:LPS heptosyltransferase
VKKRKSAVFISSGLGNSILLLPLLKKLEEQKDSISIISNSSFGGKEVLEESDINLKAYDIPSNWIGVLVFIFINWNEYDRVFLDVFSCSKKLYYIASFISKEIIAQKIMENAPNRIVSKTKVIEPIKGMHSATQNIRLLDTSFINDALNEELFSLKSQSPPSIDNKYICIQLGSANSTSNYKNWPIEKWKEFAKLFCQKYPLFKIKLLGDKTESELGKEIENINKDQIVSLIGKTDIPKLIEVIEKSILFIGSDSGLMHIAGSVSTPSITLWGPSDYNLYGWHKISSKKHKILVKEVSCRPCNSWLQPNTSRVKKPENCPDFACMKQIEVRDLMNETINFLTFQSDKIVQ